MSETIEKIGTIIGTEEGRDAVHISVLPAKAATQLLVGDHVGYKNGFGLADSPIEECIGIVDPFLKHDVQKGQHFYIFLYPRKVTSLRHVWEHPLVPAEGQEKPVLSKEVEELQKEVERLRLIEKELEDEKNSDYWSCRECY